MYVILIGIEYIYWLILFGLIMVRIDLEDYDGNKKYVEYSLFNVFDGIDYYRLIILGYFGIVGII